MNKRPPGSSPGADQKCKHIQAAVERVGGSQLLRSFDLAIKLSIALNTQLQGTPAASQFKCGLCPSHMIAPGIVCLECSNIDCLTHGRKVHASQTGHCLGVDLGTSNGSLYCFGCSDYLLNDVFEAARKRALRSVYGVRQTKKDLKPAAVSSTMAAPPFQATTGLRGFYNMGATCFISVILQSLIHNPFVRNFFLAGGHDRNMCPVGSSSECMSCFIDEMFCDFYASNSVQGYGVPNLLTLVTKLKRSFTGASEQDAHEFLQFLLDEVHQGHFQSTAFPDDSRSTTPVPDLMRDSSSPTSSPSSHENCKCVAHTTFYGQLESRLKCTRCHNVTETVDPMMDLSLEIKRVNKTIISLEDCLDLFTSAEKLDILYKCRSCHAKCPVEKQLFIKRLPSVLSIQLKRFDVAGLGANKIEIPVRFPLYLDMEKYTTESADNGGSKNGHKLQYQLFGVVCHQGSMNTGHYTCMMKDRFGRWYSFDDSMVTKIPATQVLNSDAYLLFYIITDCP